MNAHPSRSLLLLFVLVMVTGSPSVAQAPRAHNVFPVPERLKLTGIGEPNPNDDDGHLGILTALFYPIGWSKDGKFAYLVEPPDEACGCYYSEVVIQDLKNDKILWRERYDTSDEESPETGDRNSLWAKKGKEYSAKFRRYGIVPLTTFTLTHPSIESGGDVLTPKIDAKIKTDGFTVDGIVTIRMISRKYGSKMIRRDVYRPKDTNGLLSAELSGSLVSPFEPRAAVIVVEVVRGWEGPPNVTEIRIVGSTLTSGFAK
jgi:hypothetical protein